MKMRPNQIFTFYHDSIKVVFRKFISVYVCAYVKNVTNLIDNFEILNLEILSKKSNEAVF